MKSLREQFADTMLELGSKDENLIVMVGDISHGILQPFASACKGRYFNIGICEPSMVSMAAGMSKVGLTPVCHTIAPFLIERSFEQLKLDFGYQRLSGNFVSVGGAFDYAQLGCSHHSYADVSMVSHIPNSQVFCPASAHEFDTLFKSEYKKNKLNYFKLTENPHQVDYPYPIRAGEMVFVERGDDATIIALGPQLMNAANARQKLVKEYNIHCDLLYVHSVKPFDSEAVVQSLTKTSNAIVVEELSAQNGVYDLVLRSCFDMNGLRIRQLAIDGFVHGYGDYQDLCELTNLTSKDIVSAVLEFFK